MNQYNLQLSIIEENAKTSKDADSIKSLNDQIAVINAQVDALDSELAAIEAESNPS